MHYYKGLKSFRTSSKRRTASDQVKVELLELLSNPMYLEEDEETRQNIVIDILEQYGYWLSSSDIYEVFLAFVDEDLFKDH